MDTLAEKRIEGLLSIVNNFEIEGQVTRVMPLGEGFINDTFVALTEGDSPDYILQRKNSEVFPDVPAMMDNIYRVTAHIRQRVIADEGDPKREVMTVIPTNDGQLYYLKDGDYWTMTLYIADTIAYSKANSPELARKGGRGIGRFQSQLADFTEPLAETIQGFHNVRYRFKQWDECIERDTAGRVKDLKEEIEIVESHRKEMLDFWSLVERGEIPARVTHNDTKINNILFDKQGEVLCAIDLDTVMTSTSLNDFGDAIRSYCNTGEEDDRDLKRVGLSLEMFEAYTDGYLSERANELTRTELDWLAFSALYITFEQVMRFLMDYIDGDKYYKIKWVDHNLVRTHAQMRLLEDLEEKYGQMKKVVAEVAQRYLSTACA
ncbi:MAG: aminoglycoside phosphotransferase family protein [Bacteroidales bacterium]|nr:aminoglycoside phosphotransferase family protein [Bacteroidales bacterium]MCD8395520.1 aminoglycoside phosphotransferase family protein [Bacteroidales bacterium]